MLNLANSFLAVKAVRPHQKHASATVYLVAEVIPFVTGRTLTARCGQNLRREQGNLSVS